MVQAQQHFLVLGFPAQGHLNPTLQFAKRLIATGARVTLVTTVSMHRRMINKPIIDGLTFSAYSDGYDDGFTDTTDDAKVMLFVSDLKRRGSEALTNLIVSKSDEGHPFTGLIYTLFLPWAAEVARSLHVPSALLWIQPAAVLDIYYYYLRGYSDYIESKSKDPESQIKLPGLPLMTRNDLPSFLLASNIYSFAIPSLEEHFREIEKEVKPRVLVNTFEALESEAIRAVDKLNMIPIGPLIPSAFLDGRDPSDRSFGVDIFCRSSGYIEWLDSQAEHSVVYVSFGSLSMLSRRQMKEIALALLDSGRPFLWVIRDSKEKKGKKQIKVKENVNCRENGKKEEEEVNCREQGKNVVEDPEQEGEKEKVGEQEKLNCREKEKEEEEEELKHREKETKDNIIGKEEEKKLYFRQKENNGDEQEEKQEKEEEELEKLNCREEEEEEEEEEEGWRKELDKKGRIVNWCSQVEVLSHGAVGCFVTHCGWNSTIESLVSGVPMVAFPQWTDQGTNAKLIEDVWRTGMRVGVNEEGVAEGEEIRSCLDVVLGSGEKGVEMRKNAKKWKDLAREAVKEGGSSDKNLRAIVNEFARC